jgi:hypothetical protein
LIDKNTSTLGLLLGTQTGAPLIVVKAAWPLAAPGVLGAALRVGVAGLVLHEASNTAAAMATTATRGQP